MIYNKLWDMAESSVLFKSLVRMNNRIKFNDPTWTPMDKNEVSDGDLPEVTLVVSQGSGNIHCTSSTSDFRITFEWWIATGDVNVVRNILPVMWAIYCAMCGWQKAINDMTWQGKSFTKLANVGQASIGLTDLEKNRGIRGFSSIWSCEVYAQFATSDCIAQNDNLLMGN